jgi:carbonic anhydrase
MRWIHWAGAIAAMAGAGAAAAADRGLVEWAYDGPNGPAAWGRRKPAYATCERGRRQSPIDVRQPQRSTQLPTAQFLYRPTLPRVVNDAHTVRLRFDVGQTLQLGGQSLSLRQFHFHHPAGDRIEGEAFPLALHFLHKAPSGGLVAVVALFRQGAPHPGLAALLPRLPRAGQPEARLPGAEVDAREFLPATAGYYSYEGSETAPPCTEGVRWLLLQQVQVVSAQQLAQLGQLLPPNARPVQPLNGRVVQATP